VGDIVVRALLRKAEEGAGFAHNFVEGPAYRAELLRKAPENKTAAAVCAVNKVPEKMPGEAVPSKRVMEGACLQGQEDTPGTAAAAVAAGRLDKATETVPGAAEKAAEEHSLDQNTVET
jgi:hypothetical protein